MRKKNSRVPRLLGGAKSIAEILEQPHTHISRSGHYLTLNICEMAADTTIVIMEGK